MVNGKDALKLLDKSGDATVRTRMCAAEIESVLKKYDAQLLVVEVLIDGQHLMRKIEVFDRAPITGVHLSYQQGHPVANG